MTATGVHYITYKRVEIRHVFIDRRGWYVATVAGKDLASQTPAGIYALIENALRKVAK